MANDNNLSVTHYHLYFCQKTFDQRLIFGAARGTHLAGQQICARERLLSVGEIFAQVAEALASKDQFVNEFRL